MKPILANVIGLVRGELRQLYRPRRIYAGILVIAGLISSQNRDERSDVQKVHHAVLIAVGLEQVIPS